MGKVGKNLRSGIHLTLNQRKNFKRWHLDLKTLVRNPNKPSEVLKSEMEYQNTCLSMYQQNAEPTAFKEGEKNNTVIQYMG